MNTATTANIQNNNPTAFYHLPGLFEFYELYRIFLPYCEVRLHLDFFHTVHRNDIELSDRFRIVSGAAGVLHLDILIRKTCLIWCGNTASRPG